VNLHFKELYSCMGKMTNNTSARFHLGESCEHHVCNLSLPAESDANHI
jgi:hypothetical protein